MQWSLPELGEVPLTLSYSWIRRGLPGIPLIVDITTNALLILRSLIPAGHQLQPELLNACAGKG
jgi:hypothetical protein